ncbi:MAG: hypothetical protein ACR2NG_01390 [Acidimicrobiia bacterium]
MAEFQLAPPRVIYFTVPALEYPRASWPENYRFVGPGTWSPQEGQLDWLESVDRPIALVTCSTERQNDQVILESALRGLPPGRLVRCRNQCNRIPGRGWLDRGAALPCRAVLAT